MVTDAARDGAGDEDRAGWRGALRREIVWIMGVKLAALALIWWLFFRGGTA